MDLALNNLPRLVCHKTKPNQAKLKNLTWSLYTLSTMNKYISNYFF